MNHYHVTNILPGYRNVYGILPGCFQAQTPFLRRLGLQPDIGGMIMEVKLSDMDVENGITTCRIEWVPFPRIIRDDY